MRSMRLLNIPHHFLERFLLDLLYFLVHFLPFFFHRFLYLFELRLAEVECLGKLCIVQLADDGARFVKRVKLGRKPGVFNLYSTNAREMEDVPLLWAAPVLDARPPDQEGE